MMKNDTRLERVENIVQELVDSICKAYAERLRDILTESERCLMADHLKEVGISGSLEPTGNPELDRIVYKVTADSQACVLFDKLCAIIGF